MFTDMCAAPGFAREWLGRDLESLAGEFGGDYAASAFAGPDDADALPVIVPAYNGEPERAAPLIRLLASLARASSAGRKPIRPLVVVNGPQRGAVRAICEAFSLGYGTQVRQYSFSGKMRALQAAVRQLLGEEEYSGIFATTDADAIVPDTWPAAIRDHMDGGTEAMVSGGTIRYYGAAGVKRHVLLARNLGNAGEELRAAAAGRLRSHGNNHWFHADGDGVLLRAFCSVEPDIGFKDDIAITEAILRANGGRRTPMSLASRGRVAVAGDRTTSLRDLWLTLVARGDERYRTSEGWAHTTTYTRCSRSGGRGAAAAPRRPAAGRARGLGLSRPAGCRVGRAGG